MNQTKQVLVAEDDGALSDLLTSRLKAIGVKVLVSRDAAHALFLMHREPPDLVIMDVLMPAGNGMAVCEMMRDDVRLKDTPVIIITGMSGEATRLRAMDLGAHFIHKTEGLWEQIVPICADVLGLLIDDEAVTPTSPPNAPSRGGSK